MIIPVILQVVCTLALLLDSYAGLAPTGCRDMAFKSDPAPSPVEHRRSSTLQLEVLQVYTCEYFSE